MERSGWRVGVAEKDPSVPWTEDEIKRRIWALENRDEKERLIDVVGLLATLVGGGLAVIAFVEARRR